jgi:hypothetical protein
MRKTVLAVLALAFLLSATPPVFAEKKARIWYVAYEDGSEVMRNKRVTFEDRAPEDNQH